MTKSLKPVKSAPLAEGAALARIESIEPAQAEQTSVAQDQPRTELTRIDQARIKRWVANRLIDWPPTSCLHCRRPIVPGQLWTVVSNGEVTARVHQDCHGAWLAQQEVFAPCAWICPMRLEMNQSVRQEIPVICPAGSYGYVRGLPGEAGLHAAFHSHYMVAAQAEGRAAPGDLCGRRAGRRERTQMAAALRLSVCGGITARRGL